MIIDNHKWMNTFSPVQTPLPCMFGDILSQFPADTDLTSGDFATKKRRLQQKHLSASQYCFTHNQECSIHQAVDIDASGLPCPDNSRANHKRKYEEGSSGVVYITWAKKHRQNQTPLLILENVPESRLKNGGECL